MYVELHSRSAFSFLEGASIPEELIAVCSNFGMPAMALLDWDGVYGSPRFHLAAKKAKIKAHIGAEVSCVVTGQSPVTAHLPAGFRLPLLVASRVGYQNLCRLITTMKLRVGHKNKEGACASDQDFSEHADGLICLTGGGAPGRRAASGIRIRTATDGNVWSVQCLRGTATAFSSRGRI